ncbi:uncharacterized protein [Magallana gigas]|uniref:uncharacterized protein n=1 Tax=Magallana gigas TaxID=29159 RepID=UPI0033429B7A
MALESANADVVHITLYRGTEQLQAVLSRDLYEMVNDPNCDPNLKEQVYKAAVNNKTSSDTSRPSTTSSDTSRPSTTSSDTSRPSTSSSSCSSPVNGPEKVHIWKECEEKELISIRSDMKEEFEQVKNHDVLWNRITKTLNNHKVPVSCNQVKNKWKNLKKTYKKVVMIIKKRETRKLHGSILKNLIYCMEIELQQLLR